MKTTFVATTSILLSSFTFAMAVPSINGSSTEPVMKLEERVSRDGANIVVEVFSTESLSNWHYEILISIADKRSQSIAIRNGQELKEADIKLVDVNADGYLDIMIASGQDHRNKPWFKTFIFSPKTSQYRWINAMTDNDESNTKAEQVAAPNP